jgi:hypothetical protein
MPLHPDFMELLRFYGKDFRLDWCNASDEKGEQEAAKAIAEGKGETWPQDTPIFSYQGIGLAAAGIHRPYIARLLMDTANKGPLQILDIGSGSGQDGLALHTLGFRMSFMDIYGASLKFLLWRLMERRLSLPVYLWQHRDIIPHQDIAICFDVLEHLNPDQRTGLLLWMGTVAGAVYTNVIIDNKNVALHKRQTIEEVVGPLMGPYGDKMWVEPFYPDAAGAPLQYLVLYGDLVRQNDSSG